MSDKWDFYVTRMDDKPASLFVDLGIASDVPTAEHSIRLMVLVQQKAPRDDGLTTPEEADRLYPLEDALVPAVTAWGGIFVGRITWDGRRDFIFYGRTDVGFEDLVSDAIKPFEYKFKMLKGKDEGWEFYSDILYPRPDDWQHISNRHVLENLKKGGDDLSKPRRIFHWLYFADPSDRQACAASAKQMNFATRDIAPVPNADKKFPFGLQLHRIDSVSPCEVDQLTGSLVDMARKNRGDYDGWETQIVKAGGETVDDAPKD